jgi:uncharacterized protein YycO
MNRSYQPLDLLFYRGNSILARLIRYITKSEEYSHCSIFIDQLHLLETSWKQPNVIAHFGYRYTEYDVYRIKVELTDIQKEAIMSFLHQRINHSYDFKYIITRAGNFLFGTEVKSSEGKYTCDELIFQAFSIIGINLLEEEYILSPDALARSRYLELITEGGNL